MQLPRIGELLPPEITERDAIHVPIVPCTAEAHLSPGTEVLVENRPEFSRFSGTGPGLFGLLEKLDTEYRRSLTPTQEKP